MPLGKILVVDDDLDIVVYLSSFLEDHDYELESAGDTNAALEALDAFEPDLVLVDVMLPGRSGLDLLVTIRKHLRWGEIPIVMVTGSDRVLADEFKSYLSSHDGIRGPDGVVPKPINQDALLALVRRFIPQD
jgi:two-component system response regulator VicR